MARQAPKLDHSVGINRTEFMDLGRTRRVYRYDAHVLIQLYPGGVNVFNMITHLRVRACVHAHVRACILYRVS